MRHRGLTPEQREAIRRMVEVNERESDKYEAPRTPEELRAMPMPEYIARRDWLLKRDRRLKQVAQTIPGVLARPDDLAPSDLPRLKSALYESIGLKPGDAPPTWWGEEPEMKALIEQIWDRPAPRARAEWEYDLWVLAMLVAVSTAGVALVRLFT